MADNNNIIIIIAKEIQVTKGLGCLLNQGNTVTKGQRQDSEQGRWNLFTMTRCSCSSWKS